MLRMTDLLGVWSESSARRAFLEKIAQEENDEEQHGVTFEQITDYLDRAKAKGCGDKRFSELISQELYDYHTNRQVRLRIAKHYYNQHLGEETDDVMLALNSFFY